MASNSKQQKLTSFFVQNKNKNAVSGQNEKVKLSKNQRLRQILNGMQAKQQHRNPTATKEDNPYYAPILDQIEKQRKYERERLIKENKKYNKKDLGIEILNGCKQNYFHGPTYGDHTDSKASWKGYYDHRNKKMRKQFKNSDRSIYGDLSSNGIHFDQDSFHRNKTKKRDRNKLECNDNAKKIESKSNKKRKLNAMDSSKNENEHECAFGIFKGVTVYFNGRTNDLSSFHLNKVVTMNGGNFSVHPNKDVTHVITTNLARSKINKAIGKMGKFRAHKVYYVHSEWITDSVRNGVLMKEDKYLVFKTNKHGDIKNYFKTK